MKSNSREREEGVKDVEPFNTSGDREEKEVKSVRLF